MSVARKMHLAAYLKTGPTASYVSAWRHPSAPLHEIWDAERCEHLARLLEHARFDAGFFADGLGLPDIYKNSYADFVGRGDMSRGGLLLRCVRSRQELTYAPVRGAVRSGRRPPKLEPLHRAALPRDEA